MMAHMDKKRKALSLRPLMYAKSFLEEASAEPAAAASQPEAALAGQKG